MSLMVEEVQPSLFPLPPRMPEYRRVVCGCGCRCWFYARRAKGRPPKFVNLEHYRKERNARRRAERAHAPVATHGVHAPAAAPAPDRENVLARPRADGVR